VVRGIPDAGTPLIPDNPARISPHYPPSPSGGAGAPANQRMALPALHKPTPGASQGAEFEAVFADESP
jgi:hypothetical protein